MARTRTINTSFWNVVLYAASLALLFAAPVSSAAQQPIANRSVIDCIARFKATLSEHGLTSTRTMCTLLTASNLEIEVIGDFKPLENTNDLMLSDISNFFRSFFNHDQPSTKKFEDKVLVDALPTARVYRLSIEYLDDYGKTKAIEDVVGLIRSYAVLGNKKMYWVRCNAGKDDNCVVFANIFEKRSPDGTPSQPTGAPWPPQDAPCFIWIRHRFKDSPGGTQLPETIDTIEALVDGIGADKDMPKHFENYCHWKALPK